MNIKTLPLSSNCYIVSDEDGKTVVFDPCERGEELYAYVKELNLELCAVIITHAHFDHIYGLSDFMKCVENDGNKIPVYIHSADAAAMSDSEKNLSKPLFGTPYTYTGTLRCVFDGDTVNVGKMSFLVISTPGHTEGSACYICHKDRTVFTGDVLFDGSIGRTDFPGGDINKMRASLKRILSIMGDYAVYPGHGGTTTLGQERNFNPFVAQLGL